MYCLQRAGMGFLVVFLTVWHGLQGRPKNSDEAHSPSFLHLFCSFFLQNSTLSKKQDPPLWSINLAWNHLKIIWNGLWDKFEGDKVQLSKNACNGKLTNSFFGSRPPISATGNPRGFVGDAFGLKLGQQQPRGWPNFDKNRPKIRLFLSKLCKWHLWLNFDAFKSIWGRYKL